MNFYPFIVPCMIAGIVFCVFFLTCRRLVRRHGDSGNFCCAPFSAADTSTQPRAILDARYAKGEISRDEYMQMKRDLRDEA